MRSFLIASAIVLPVACASAPPEPTLEGPTGEYNINVVYADADSRGVTITRDSYVSRARIMASRQAAFNALPEAFTDLGLPLPLMDRGRWTVAVQQFRSPRRLGDERLSRYFDCGSTIAGLNADVRRLELSVYALVQPTDEQGTTTVQIRADAVAHTTEGSGAPPITCTSSGLLESRLAKALQLRALQAGG
jgi:hypothetical protein